MCTGGGTLATYRSQTVIEPLGSWMEGGLDRVSPQGDIVPSLSDITKAISDAGNKFGSGPKYGGSRYCETVQAAERELKVFMRFRDQEEDPGVRKTMSLEVFKMKKTVMRLKASERCMAAAEKYAVPAEFKKHGIQREVFGLIDEQTEEKFSKPSEISKHVYDFLLWPFQ